jgi:hypothetical protein
MKVAYMWRPMRERTPGGCDRYQDVPPRTSSLDSSKRGSSGSMRNSGLSQSMSA